MKNTLLHLLIVSLGVLVSTSAAKAADAADQPLILTLKSDIYGFSGPENQFTIYLGSTQQGVEVFVKGPKTEEYVELSPYYIGEDSDGNGAAIATPITCSVSETDNTIRIYGDASKIDYIDVHGCYLNSVTLNGNFINLEVVDLSHNYLTEIDLSPFASLISIDLMDNAFIQPSKMKIGTNHPELALLSVGINEVIDPELDLKNFPALQYFNAYNNHGITSVDPTGCPELVSLQLDVTNISSIDISKNPKLDRLNLSQTRVSSIDLSHNPNLGELYINHEGSFNSDNKYKLTQIDLSNNPYIEYLDLGGNLLTEIDLSHNSYIKMLYLMRNYLTSIDLSNCTRLSSVNLSNNLLNFSTLPLPEIGWDYLYYQRPLPTELKYKVGDRIDFSSEVLRAPYVDSEGNKVTPSTFAIVYAQPRAKDEYEVDESAYTFENGVLTFLEAIPDTVYVQFHCTVFDEWDLKSAPFMVKTPEEFDLPSTAFSFKPAASMGGGEIALSLGARATAQGYSLPVDVTLLVGKETTVLEKAVTTSGMPGSPNVRFTLPSEAPEVKVCLPDGFMATSLAMDGIELTSIDLSPSDLLTTLSITDASLSSIDLGYNSSLESLTLKGNKLTRLSLAGVRGDFEKWSLRDIDVSDNNLSSITAVTYESIRSLNLAGNRFSNFDAKYYTGLTALDISRNNLKGELDLELLADLETLNVSGNSLYSLVLADKPKLKSLDVSNNSFTFATLPLPAEGMNYEYAPQEKMQILAMAPAINLSAQNIMSEGKGGTNYTWRYATDNTVVDESKYTAADGAFKFDSSLIGESIYCEMTNPLFPDFDAMPLSTTPTVVSEQPTTLVASFTTSTAGAASVGFQFHTDGDNAVYIDWRGDGTEYQPYIYEANNTQGVYRTGQTFAGATAKVYTFGSAEEISGMFINSTPLTDFDGTPMVKLLALDIHNAGLKDGKIKLPQSPDLFELVLDGNAFSSQTFPGLPGLRNLNLAGNNYKSIDLSGYPELTFAQLSNNAISSVKFGKNDALYQLDLQANKLSDIDFSGLRSLSEILLSDNNLQTIDLSPVKDRLRALWIAGNRFTFATLPLPEETGENMVSYDYANQQPMAVTVTEGNRIDLSSQAQVGGEQTEYRWFLGNRQSDVYYDYQNEQFVGEELEGPAVSSDPEFVVENGITTFLYPQSSKVICAMTNSMLPSLILYTEPAGIDVTAVEEIFADESGIVNVYTISGMWVRRAASLEEAVSGLAPGLYVINGYKVLVRE